MILNRHSFLLIMMLVPMIASGAVVNAAEATLPSPEEVQHLSPWRHYQPCEHTSGSEHDARLLQMAQGDAPLRQQQ